MLPEIDIQLIGVRGERVLIYKSLSREQQLCAMRNSRERPTRWPGSQISALGVGQDCVSAERIITGVTTEAWRAGECSSTSKHFVLSHF